MCALDGFGAEVERRGGGRRGPDRGVSTVGQRAGLARAEAGDVVGVAAEGVRGGLLRRARFAVVVRRGAELEGAELLVYYLPDDLVRGHLLVI